MKDHQTVQRFIGFRARGRSFVHLADEFGVAKNTFTEWSRKFRFDIYNCHVLELDAPRIASRALSIPVSPASPKSSAGPSKSCVSAASPRFPLPGSAFLPAAER